MTSFSTVVTGVNANTTADTVFVVLDNVSIQGLGTAIYARNNTRMNVFNSTISNNNRGIFAEFNTSAVYLSNTSIFNNAVNIQLGTEPIKPKVFSYGNNQIIPLPPVGILSTISSQ